MTQSTIACALEQHLLHLKHFAYRLDGDNIRFGLNKDLGFSDKDRTENIRRIGEVGTPSSRITRPVFDYVIHRFQNSSQMRRRSQSLRSYLRIVPTEI